jgi:hypothetical protein
VTPYVLSSWLHAAFRPRSAHIAAVLVDQGLTARTATFAASVFGGELPVGRVGSCYLLDRLFAPRVAAVIFGCAAAGMGLLRIADPKDLRWRRRSFIGLRLGARWTSWRT